MSSSAPERPQPAAPPLAAPEAQPVPAPVAAGASLDRISLRGLAGFGYHGVYPEERRDGQRFVVDVTCAIDLSVAAASDDLTHTVHYGELAEAIVADIERDPLDLIEALADRIARTCLQAPRVEAVEVTVHKPAAPIPVEVADVAVTLTRSKR